MAIVCYTSPLSYLILIGQADLFSKLYGTVHIPPAVEEELAHPDAPPAVQRWIQGRPRWLNITSLEASAEAKPSMTDALEGLDRGEQAAIRLAVEISTDLLVLDERDGRQVARQLNVPITGTIGVLDVAASEGFIEVPETISRLRKTSFRASPELYRWLLDRHRKDDPSA